MMAGNSLSTGCLRSEAQSRKWSDLLSAVAFFALVLFLVPVGVFAVDKPEAAVEKIRARCVAILQQAMRSENAFVRGAAARAAGESGDASLIPLLKKAAGDVYHTTRLFALKGLNSVSEKEAQALAETMARDSNVWVQSAALELLAERQTPAARDLILPHLESPDRPVRLAAAAALVRLGEKQYLDNILKAARDPNALERYQAIGYLGKMPAEKSLHVLMPLLENDEEDTVYYSLKAMGKKVPRKMAPLLNKLTHSENPSVRYQAVLLMGYLPPKISRVRVLELCEDADAMVRVSAAVAMTRMRLADCERVFSKELKHPDYGIRSTTARILGELPLSQRPALLSGALNDSNTRVRTSAVRAVGMMGGAEAFPLLVRMLEDPQEAVRAYAAGGLLKLTR